MVAIAVVGVARPKTTVLEARRMHRGGYTARQQACILTQVSTVATVVAAVAAVAAMVPQHVALDLVERH